MSSVEAINGLLISNDHLEIISNNIANASTIGYKSSQPIFFDMLSHSFYTKNINGSGVGISSILQNFNDGMLVETGRPLDLGISKDGFFRVLDSRGHVYYTRNGQFLLDKNKNIVNTEGMYLTGKNKSYSTDIFNNPLNLEPINLKDSYLLKNKGTSEVTCKFHLKNSEDLIISGPEDYSHVNQYSEYINMYNQDIEIYDKSGEKVKINISFSKKNQKTWQVNVKSNESNDSGEKDIDSSFNLKFNSNGELISDAEFNIKPNNNSKYENINLNLTGTLAQIDLKNSLEESSQDGYPKGDLQTFNIIPNGEIIATYSNQKEQMIGQILLSKFINPEKLQPESGNVWSATVESGAENIGVAGDDGFGVLSDKTLETSNVDLNKELINMIIAQRNYQSNAQSFKAEDKIISTLINLR